MNDFLPILISLIAVIIAGVSAAIGWKRAPGDIGETMTKIANMNAEKRLTLEGRVKELEEIMDRIKRKRYAVTVVFISDEEENVETVEKVEVKRLKVNMEKT